MVENDTKPQFKIRSLCEADCIHIGPLLRRVWLHAYKGIQTEAELLAQSYKVHTPELIHQEIGDPAVHSIVAEVDGRVVGHARSNLEDGYVEVFRLYLEQEFYGRGIGKSLLDDIENHFSEITEFRLDVFEDNHRALNFYLACGYEIVERSSEIQSQGVDVFDLKMRKIRKT